MRYILLLSIFPGLAAPLQAQQERHDVVVIRGDTVITARTGDQSECKVVIKGETIGESEARALCERAVASTALHQERASTLQRRLAEVQGRLNLDSRNLAEHARELSTRTAEMSERMLALRSEQGALRDAIRSPLILEGILSEQADRAIIGVSVDPRPRESDQHGAYVAGVTPNYPAEKAGIKVGDIITVVDGKSLTAGRTERAPGTSESLPWIRLTEIVGKLQPGKEVSLEYRRGNSNHTTRITPIADRRWAPTELAWEFGPASPTSTNRGIRVTPSRPLEAAAAIAPLMREGWGSQFAFFGGALSELELAPMNQGLGEYFGTSEGVLVISTPEEGALGLRAGDVVTGIDGRNIESPSELLRVLRSYDEGDSFIIEVLRKRSRQSVEATLP